MDLTDKNLDSGSEPQREQLEFTVMPEAGPEPSLGGDEPVKRPNKLGQFPWKAAGLWAAAAIALGILGYLVYAKWGRTKPQSTIQTPNITVPAVQKKESADGDFDGLTDEEEKRLGTNPQRADTDGDGLADGDEINIYHSDPLLYDTDGDGYNDGQEVAFGYSPLKNTTEKAPPEEVQAWTERIAKFGLHEPTKTTLKLRAGIEVAPKVAYQNAIYKYSIDLPSVVTWREADDKRTVGLYVAGTTPSDADVSTDPISFSVAVAVAGQTLKDWVLNQYAAGTYTNLSEQDIGRVRTVKLSSVKGEVCAQDKVFFSKDGTVIIATLTCNESQDFRAIFDQVVKSFKFIP